MLWKRMGFMVLGSFLTLLGVQAGYTAGHKAGYGKGVQAAAMYMGL